MSDSDHTHLLVITETSRYVLDHVLMSAMRLPGGGGGAVDGLPPPVLAHLRCDAEALHLLAWPEPRVGEPMTLLLHVREDGIPTVRTTTIVREIRQY
jgi:hypothetical protein